MAAGRTLKDVRFALTVGNGTAKLTDARVTVENIPVTADATLALTGKYEYAATVRTKPLAVADVRKLVPEADLAVPVEGLIETEANPSFALEPGFVEGVRQVGRHGLPFDICVKHWSLVFGVELDDGRRTPRGPAFEDTIHNRMFCGEGEFDVPSFIATLLRIGYAGAWGVEIISDELRAMPLTDGLRRARAATLDCFRAASGGALPPAGER